MDFSILISIISIVSALSSVVISIVNFISSKNEMKIKINTINKEITLNKINIEKLLNVSLNEQCENIVKYFENVSKENKYTVSIFRIMNNKKIKKISSSSKFDENYFYSINENTEFFEVSNTKTPYYNNDIPYFTKHGKNYFNSNPNWHHHYTSIICCPITNSENTILGFLTVEIMKPLNDLIDINKIINFLQQKCHLISINQEFINY